MGREWAIQDEEFKKLFFYIQQIEQILDGSRMRHESLIGIKEILDNARLRDPRFKKE